MGGMWVDNETPGLARAWYAVALARDLGVAPISVRVLGRDWAVVRLDDGIAAFEDRCPHRLAPLSIGTVRGATLQCRYHGWEIERSGACVRIPALGEDVAIPSKARVDTPFGLVERYGLVWLAPEEPVADIPDFHEWDDPGFDTCWNEPRRTTAGAVQLTDNFLDATHLPTVHTTTFGVADDAFLPHHEVHRDGWRASTTYVAPYRNHDDPLVATGEHPLVQEHHLYKELAPATTALIRLNFPMTGGVITILFSCLPHDNGSSTVFKMIARNDFAGDRAKIDESIGFEDRVMDEDLAILESYDHIAVPLDTRVEVHTRADKLGLAYRRVLAEMIGATSE
jgi:phenylpropionate dioxygenase-like ring-hydroxylating dioxygenase large terminal subunit